MAQDRKLIPRNSWRYNYISYSGYFCRGEIFACFTKYVKCMAKIYVNIFPLKFRVYGVGALVKLIFLHHREISVLVKIK